MSSFWSGWIIVLTVGNILACFWLIWWTMRPRSGEAATGDVTGHTWDGDLQEYNNPLPRWWLWLFYGTLIFAGLYLALYPGLGGFKGLLGWSSHGSQYESEMARADERYSPIFAKYAAVGIEELASKPEYQEARDMGKRMYLSYCTQCHGSAATGYPGFPNLTDDDWLWGGTPDLIKQTILQGRGAEAPPELPAAAYRMPAQQQLLGDEGIEEVTQYVISLSGREADAAKAEKGKQHFTNAGCIGCHGLDGKGNQMLGAPNLTDDIWLYGGSAGKIRETLVKGRHGVMPAFADWLGEDKVHLITAYVYSLSQ